MTTDTVSISESNDTLTPFSANWLQLYRDVSGSPIEISDVFSAFLDRIEALGEMMWESSELPDHARMFGEMICNTCSEASAYSDLWFTKARANKHAMRQPTAHGVDDNAAEAVGTNEGAVSSDALREAVQNGVYPRWWGDLSTDGKFDQPQMLPQAFEEFARRVETIAHYLRTAEMEDTAQPQMAGQFLDELAFEARSLVRVWQGAAESHAATDAPGAAVTTEDQQA